MSAQQTAVTTFASGGRGSVRLLREVATSPAASLFAAEREVDGVSELVSVKLLHQAVERAHVVGLQQRAQTLASLQHRHIVTPDAVLDVGGRFGLVSPFVDGIDLLEWVEVLRENNTQMPPRVVCELMRAIAVALDAAMSRVPWGRTKALKFIHADLKPTNVMVTRDGEIKVLDFGTGASNFEGLSDVPTRTARNYLSPERALGRPPTPVSDIYSLGILGIELLHDSWLHVVPSAPVEHDQHLAQLVRSSEFKLRSAADQQTLRSLLLRMSRHSPGARPSAAVVAQTLRRLADRAPGPSLESFAHENAAPWLMTIPEDPQTNLMVQIEPVVVESVDFNDSTERTITQKTDFKKIFSEDPSAIFLRGAPGDWEEEDSETQSIALETSTAFQRKRGVPDLQDDATIPDAAVRVIGDDDPTFMADGLDTTDVTDITDVTDLNKLAPIGDPMDDLSDDFAPTEVVRLDDLKAMQEQDERNERARREKAARQADAEVEQQAEGLAPIDDAEDIQAEVVQDPDRDPTQEVVRYEDVRIQEGDFESEGPSTMVLLAVAASMGCLGFAVVSVVVFAGLALGFYLAA